MTLKHLAFATALFVPIMAQAQTNGVTYCKSLAAEYEKYYVKRNGHNTQTGPTDGAVAVAQCNAGNTAGIPVLEQKLRDAKVTLPSRG